MCAPGDLLQIEKCWAHHRDKFTVPNASCLSLSSMSLTCQGQSMIALWCVRIPPDCSWQRRLSGAKSSISRSVRRLA